MIIRRLEFSGIGPFGKKQGIDFTELTQNGIFLLEGPTGAGKSSILDALVFALYGGVAGKDSSDERLRSTYALAQEESYVDLIFTTSKGTYRVWRSPAWRKPKTRGEGFTEQAQKARLWKLSEAALESGNLEDAQAISSQARESNQELREIIGLDKHQFLQTVLLPQGQFADFLRLKSAERAPLLEKIFATTPYRNLAELLKKQSNHAQKEIAGAHDSYQKAIETWLGIEAIDSDIRAEIAAARADLTEIFPASANCDKKLLALLTQGAAALADSAAKKADTAQAARTTAEDLRNRWEAEKDLAAALELREKLAAEWGELQKEKPKIAKLRQQLEKHQQSTAAYKELQSWRQQRENYAEELAALSESTEVETTEKSTVSATALDSPKAAGAGAGAKAGTATAIINAIEEIGETFSAAVSQLEAKIFSPPAAALEQKIPDFLADNAEN
ncbi:SMC family ATPase, partial [uncultured Arcanobacterium sp.]|uniref:AAA family ATPase n=1 Tax=uncultured Arcanobacterium sp. TaxID=487520 RepID=UPI00262BD6A2